MSGYQRGKERARREALDWSYDQASQPMSYEELAICQERFERLGRRYGLLREFRENAIC